MLRVLVAAGFLICLPAMASQTVTVAQLEDMLRQRESAHKSDGAIAQELSEAVLREELTAPALQRIRQELQPGPQTMQALDLLADASALLPPPAGEVPPDPRPDMAAQRAMFTAAIEYVAKTLHQLPDFLAARETRSFDDIPGVLGHSGYAPVTPLHLVGTFRRDITYRGGKEVVEVAQTSGKGKSEPGPRGLNTWGEFGPVLGTILVDSLKGSVTWSRWEQHGSAGRVAVFRYAVPAAASHYRVDFCCVWHEYDIPEDGNTQSYHGTPAYDGELYLDPKTGAVVRVTLEAELGSNEVIREAAISIQYSAIEIGGKNYICPTRSIAISQTMDRPGKVIGGTPPVTRINETSFVGYHRFGSSSRIFAGVPPGVPAPEKVAPEADSSTATAKTPPARVGPTAAASTEDSATREGSTRTERSNTSPESIPATREATAKPAPATVLESAEPIPESNAQTAPVLKTTTREVILDVVVTKSNGDPVNGLMKQDFAVSENGHPQTIDFFEGHTPDERASSTAPEMPPLPTGAVTNVPPEAAGDAVNVLLLDSLNTPPQEQSNVQRQILEFLRKAKPGTRMAVFTLGTKLHFVQAFTSDTSQLAAAVNRGGLDGEKNGLLRSDTAEDDSDAARLLMMQASPIAIDALRNANSEARSADLGAHAAMTFEALTYLAHYLSGVPGRKNLLWFSSSFPVVIFPTEEESKNIEKNRSLVQRTRQTADLFAASQISVYPIGAEGMMTEHVMEADVAGPASTEGSGHIGSGAGETMRAYNAEAGQRARVTQAMDQLAASTGGKAFYNTNDLNAAMQRAIEDGARYYTIGYSPADKAMDGSFRRIDVRVNSGKYKLAYRRGYNAEERPETDPNAHVNPLADLLDYGLPAATGILYGIESRAKETEAAAAADRAGENSQLKGALTRYRINLTIRTSDVELKPDGNGFRSGRLLIGLKAYDRDGHAVNWEATDETLRVSEKDYSAALKSGIPMHLAIDLPANSEEHLVTAVYDWNSGKAGTLEVRLPASDSN